jgi:hypothetical protein
MPDLESSKDNSNGWGGAREGAGRPKGSMNELSLERMKVKSAFIERINRNTDKLFNAQLNLALGETYLLWKHKVGTGEKARIVTEVVDDIEIIKAYLDETLEVSDGEFYFLSTKPANGMALDSLLNRSFGKAEEKIDHTTNGKDMPAPILGGVSNNKITDGVKRDN